MSKRNRLLAIVAATCMLSAPAAALAAITVKGTGGTAAGPDLTARIAQLATQRAAARTNVRLARTLARRHGRDLPHAYVRRAYLRPTGDLQRSNRALRRQVANAQPSSASASLAGVPRAVLAAIAACESGGNPAAIGGGGAYRGLFQMTFSAWSGVGGHGDPARASVAEQYHRAALLYRSAGPGQWPVCAR